MSRTREEREMRQEWSADETGAECIQGWEMGEGRRTVTIFQSLILLGFPSSALSVQASKDGAHKHRFTTFAWVGVWAS